MTTTALQPTTRTTYMVPGDAANEAGITPTTAKDKSNLRRLKDQQKMAAAAGLALPHPVYALGTPVNSTGVGNFQAKRAEWSERPGFGLVCDQAVERIAAEARTNLDVDLGGLRMDATGKIGPWVGPDAATRYSVTEAGLYRLLKGIGVGSGTRYLVEAPADLRATNVNYWCQSIADAGGKPWTLRTRRTPAADGTMNGAREVFAAVSPKYPCLDADQLAKVAKRLVPDGARGELLYDGERFRLGASWFNDINPEDACAGEVFRGYMFLDTRDDGLGSIRVRWGVERNLCLNLIILGKAEAKLKVRHDGTVQELADAVSEAMSHAADAMAPFAAAWTKARRTDLFTAITTESKWSVDHLLRGLVEEDLVRVAGVSTDEMVRRLGVALAKEREIVGARGLDVADVVNAITRAAHENAWASPWVTEQLEEQAGELLFNRVYWSDVVEAGQAATAAA